MNPTELPKTVHVLDSHTAGEPTRVVISGGPDLGSGSMAERRDRFRQHFDGFRSAILNEPRGSDVWVGALLCPPVDPTNVAGVIFFNNVGYLGMCGHGTIGLAVTLAHLGRIGTGRHRLETPVGLVTFTLHDDQRVTVDNVPSYRLARQMAVEVPELGRVVGDIAWGGNWFFLIEQHGQSLHLSNVAQLTDFTGRVRQALTQQGITGAGGGEIDHVELFGPPQHAVNHSRNFVLCPGGAYDRSPCGTGTSAKLACLFAEGKLAPGTPWRQEGILGSVFEGTYQPGPEGTVLPSITGSAYLIADSTLLFDPRDPFREGIRA